MFLEWNFEFHWFTDNNDLVPIACGGLLLISKRWRSEGGGYDIGMLECGAENIEQSFKAWTCRQHDVDGNNSEIVVAQDAKVGHIYSRPDNPAR